MRLTAHEKVSWDDSVSRGVLGLVQEVADRLKAGDDPVRGLCLVKFRFPCGAGRRQQHIVDIVEDAAWLRGKQDTAHINRAELDAVLTGINMAVKWSRHVNQLPYLSLVDTASRFVIFRPLRNELGKEIAGQLRQVFCDFGPPEAMLSDNGSCFLGREVQYLLSDWKIKHELSCAYRSRGNAVAERAHRTVKRGAKWGGRTVEEAVFLYNVTGGRHEANSSSFLQRNRANPGRAAFVLKWNCCECLRRSLP